MQTESSPKWEHDCDACHWLGTVEDSDWYVCGVSERSLIERHSSEPSDYSSVPIAGCVEPSTLELRAALMGFNFTKSELAKFGLRYLRGLCYADLERFRKLCPSEGYELALGTLSLENY